MPTHISSTYPDTHSVSPSVFSHINSWPTREHVKTSTPLDVTQLQWSEFFNAPDPDLDTNDSELTFVSALDSRSSTPLMDVSRGSPVPSLCHTRSTNASPLGRKPPSPLLGFRRRSLSHGAIDFHPSIPDYPLPESIAKGPSGEFMHWERGRRPIRFEWEDGVAGGLIQMDDDE